MSTKQNGMAAAFGEGYGAPINIDYSTSNKVIDPTLDSCCQRELESNIRYNAVQRTLRQHDRVAIAERMRRNAVKMMTQSGACNEGCRCTFDPNQDGGEYDGLARLKMKNAQENLEEKSDDDSTNNNFGRAKGSNTFEDPAQTHLTSNENCDDRSDSDEDSEFDYLLDGLDEVGTSEIANDLEARRREELESVLLTRENLAHHGYGVHRQMNPGRVLDAAGLGLQHDFRDLDEAVVLHLYDPESEESAALDYILETKISQKFGGTRFLRSNGRAVINMNQDLLMNSFQSLNKNALSSSDLPALLAIRRGEVVALSKNLIELKGSVPGKAGGYVDEGSLEHWLHMSGVLRHTTDAPQIEMLCRIRPEEDALIASGILGADPLSKTAGNQGLPTFFRCGVPGCEKTYRHEHVGVKTEEQSGLVVKIDMEGNATSIPSL